MNQLRKHNRDRGQGQPELFLFCLRIVTITTYLLIDSVCCFHYPERSEVTGYSAAVLRRMSSANILPNCDAVVEDRAQTLKNNDFSASSV